MSKYIKIGFLILLVFVIINIAGCGTTQTNVDVAETISHPDLPRAVQPYQFDFHVITQGNMKEKINEDSVFLAIDYNESLFFRQFLEDMKRYMLEANGVICYYRQDLKEKFCSDQKTYIELQSKESQTGK